MSYLAPDFDFGKPSKSGLEKSLRTKKMALRIGEKFASFACLFRIALSLLSV